MSALVIEALSPCVSGDRLARMTGVLAGRSPSLSVVLHRLHNPHNIGACLRTCDGLGVHEARIVDFPDAKADVGPPGSGGGDDDNDGAAAVWSPQVRNEQRLASLATASSGAAKWLGVEFVDTGGEWATNEPGDVVAALKSDGYTVLASHVGDGKASHPLHDHLTSLDRPGSPPHLALMFGNEHAGLPDEVVSAADAVFHLPQWGMAESFNVSVAVALSLAACDQTGWIRRGGMAAGTPEGDAVLAAWLLRDVPHAAAVVDALAAKRGLSWDAGEAA